MQAVTESTGIHPPERFAFTGSGAEYFRIWIVNLLLTILTLGIYSAWAKVRRLQYFSRHTRVAGSVFDYHGSPIAILIGRAIAFALFLIYSIATSVPGPLVIVAVVMVGVLLPWMLRNSFRFRLHNTSYRSLRFSFRGSLGGAYLTFLVYGVLAFITLYLLAPFTHQRIKAYQHGQSWFGKTPFSFNASVGGFYGVYLIVLLIFIGGAIGGAVLFGGAFAGLAALGASENGEPPGPEVLGMLMPLILGMVVFFVLLSLIVGPLFMAKIGNLVWNGTRLGDHRFESTMKVWPLMWIGVSNFVLVVLTLGLFMPWAAVRVARYRAECLALLPASDLDAFLADTAADVSARGEEMAEMFDFDIGL
jgi:uncharacterized membrane protein YjgN (DUF898 family)